jgi:hypothetical protein
MVRTYIESEGEATMEDYMRAYSGIPADPADIFTVGDGFSA